MVGQCGAWFLLIGLVHVIVTCPFASLISRFSPVLSCLKITPTKIIFWFALKILIDTTPKGETLTSVNWEKKYFSHSLREE